MINDNTKLLSSIGCTLDMLIEKFNNDDLPCEASILHGVNELVQLVYENIASEDKTDD